ncbi:MAG: hypothetical protein KDJ66_12825 [Nitratireductor sp.]|nr:hypothetical protein [Nitratireductor sp.]
MLVKWRLLQYCHCGMIDFARPLLCAATHRICRHNRLQGVAEFAGDITSFDRETDMKSIITGLGMASLLALGSAGAANAASMSMAADCNTAYAACVAASDTSMAATPQDAMSKFQMNTMHVTECNTALQACYAGAMQ